MLGEKRFICAMSALWHHMGTLLRPHGIKGEFCIEWYADSPLLLDMPLWLQRPQESSPQPIHLRSVRHHNRRVLITLEGVEDRTAAESLRGSKLLSRRDDLPELADDEVYVQDILGQDVFLADGSRLGRLDHLECATGQEIWAIVTNAGQEVLFPAKPEFILRFDKEHSSIYISPPPGLLEIYLASDG